MTTTIDSYVKSAFPSIKDYSIVPNTAPYPVLLWMNWQDLEETQDLLLQFGHTTKVDPAKQTPPLRLRNGLDARVVPLVSPSSNRRSEQYKLLVGRRPENDIHLGLPEISRFHSELHIYASRSGMETHLQDKGSDNGTFHNKTRLSMGISHRLADFDDVAFGPVQFKYLGPEQLRIFLDAVKSGTILL